MQMKSIAFLLFLFSSLSLYAQPPVEMDTATTVVQLDGQLFHSGHRSLSTKQMDGRKALLVRGTQNTKDVVWLQGRTFKTGTIEFDIRGRDDRGRSFVGFAFHGQDDDHYETVYFRPFNFNASNAVGRSHSVQYIAPPYLEWHVLRQLRTDEFENDLGSLKVDGNDWFHVRLVIDGKRILAYVNDQQEAVLDVPSLRPNWTTGKLGFWVGNWSEAEFANLTIR